MLPCEGNKVTETLSLPRPWVKKGFADDWFLHRQPQDGNRLSGPALSGHAQLRAERHALRCQDLVGELNNGVPPAYQGWLASWEDRGIPNSLAWNKTLTWFSGLSLETGKQRQKAEETPNLHGGCSMPRPSCLLARSLEGDILY